ncbi:type IV toxin-antitoxin system AbiEi family antitoxin domain-containing protein [uncultured Friedmanniella sp.]|uniref:type IV toxin-antitoxin system AbiEi family antitoxin domain-containing protein n=1 Tax=uncultured Friedmanniella sp. TaxID=335381 RepID=UPI0035CB12B4
MHPREDPSVDLLRLASLQGGVLSTEQVAGHGLGKAPVQRLLRQGHWQRLERSIYLTTAQPADWTAEAWAGVLLGGSAARLGGSAAGFLHGLVSDEPRPITVLVPADQVTRSRYPWRFRRETADVRDRRTPGSPPRTTVEDTVLDLCDEGSVGMAIGWVTKAVQSRRTTVPQLRRALRRRHRVRHRGLLEELLGDVADGVESPLELRYLRDVERAHRLPKGERQLHGRTPFRRDVAYPQYRLVVELDGRLGHEGMHRFRDMWRDNVTTVGGERTLRYGSFDVNVHPCLVAHQVGTVLQQQGREDAPARCPRCPINV